MGRKEWGGVTLGVVVAGWLSLGAASADLAVGVTRYSCGATVTQLFDDSNPFGVDAGGAPPTFTTGGKAYCLDQIQTYHWNDNGGPTPGKLSLKAADGKVLGPFQALGSAGTNNVPNVNWYWYAPHNPPVIIEGTYTCEDSQPATWSSNKQSGGLGFCHVYVREATLEVGPTTPTSGPGGGGGGGVPVIPIAAGIIVILVGVFSAGWLVNTHREPDWFPVHQSEEAQGCFDELDWWFNGTPPQPPPPLPPDVIEIHGDSGPPPDEVM